MGIIRERAHSPGQEELTSTARDVPAELWFADAQGQFHGGAPEPPDLARALVPLIRRVAASGDREAIDVQPPAAAGEPERLYRAFACAVPGGSADSAVAVAIVDLSRLWRMMRRFGMIMRATRHAAWEIDLRTGHVWWNDQAYELFGYDRSTTITFDHFASRLHPEDRERILAHNQEILDGEEVDWDNEYRLLRSDGDICFIRDRGYIDRDASGKPRRMVGVHNEITKQRTAEQELGRSEQRYRSLVGQMTDAMFVVDSRGRITDVNPQACESLGYGREELLEMTAADVIPALGAADFKSQVWDTLQANQPVMLETVHRRKDGSRFPVEIRLALVEVESEPAILGLARDITERKQAEEQRRNLEAQVQQAQKLESLGVLAGGIAHDFNNLLVGILGNVDLALIDLPPTSPARAHMTEIATTAVRAAELAGQMLAYAGKGKFVLERLDLGELVQEIHHLLEVAISKKATLVCELASDLPAVEADPTQLRQVVMNLILNASEALGSGGGKITVRTGARQCDRAYLQTTYLDEDLAEGVYVYVEVSDTGRGMSAEVQDKVFDPFFTTKFTGRGLGLAAVLGIVRGHRGAIKVSSEPGRGTTFRVLLPAIDQPADNASVPEPNDLKWQGGGKVLLVDDEETVLKVGQRMLERMGFHVLTATNGLTALEQFAEHAADLRCVVLDLTMPYLDGEETLKEIRRVSAEVPVVLSSGFTEQAVGKRFAGRDLAGFIQKPYTYGSLREVIRSALEK